MAVSDFDFLISQQNEDSTNPYFADELPEDTLSLFTTNSNNTNSNSLSNKLDTNNNEDTIIRKRKRVVIDTPPSIDTITTTNNNIEEGNTNSRSYIDINIINHLADSIVSKIENKLKFDSISDEFKSKSNSKKLSFNTNFSKSENEYDDIITCSKYKVNNKTNTFNFRHYNNSKEIFYSSFNIISIPNPHINTLMPPFDGEVFNPYVENNFYAGSRDENLVKVNPGIKNQRLFLKRRADALNRIYNISPTEKEKRINIEDVVLDLNLHLDLFIYLLTGETRVNSMMVLDREYNIFNKFKLRTYSKVRPQEIFTYDTTTKKITMEFSKYIEFKIWLYEKLQESNLELRIMKNMRMINMLLFYYEHRTSDEEFKIYYNNIITNNTKFIHENMNKEVRLYGTIHYRTYYGKQYKENLLLYVTDLREIKDRNISDIKSKSIILESISMTIPNNFRNDKLDFDFTPGNEIAFIGTIVRNTDSANRAKYTVKISYVETFMSKANMKKYQEYDSYQKYKSYSKQNLF